MLGAKADSPTCSAVVWSIDSNVIVIGTATGALEESLTGCAFTAAGEVVMVGTFALLVGEMLEFTRTGFA